MEAEAVYAEVSVCRDGYQGAPIRVRDDVTTRRIREVRTATRGENGDANKTA